MRRCGRWRSGYGSRAELEEVPPDAVEMPVAMQEVKPQVIHSASYLRVIYILQDQKENVLPLAAFFRKALSFPEGSGPTSNRNSLDCSNGEYQGL